MVVLFRGLLPCNGVNGGLTQYILILMLFLNGDKSIEIPPPILFDRTDDILKWNYYVQINILSHLAYTCRLVPDETMHKGNRKRHKMNENCPFYGARSSVNIWNSLNNYPTAPINLSKMYRAIKKSKCYWRNLHISFVSFLVCFLPPKLFISW